MYLNEPFTEAPYRALIEEASLLLCKAYDEEEKLVGEPLAVEVKPLANFFTAEEYHQKYLDKNPAGYCHIPAEFFTLADDK